MVRPLSTDRRISSTPHYQTFPTAPPKSKGLPLSEPSSPSNGLQHDRSGSRGSISEDSPCPTRQLSVLVVMSLCEQTALNSVGAYLPQMVSAFPSVKPDQVGLYVGVMTSSFAIAQIATYFSWRRLLDRIGRRPIVFTRTLLTAACFVAFGLCRTLGQALLIQILMGLVNGNQGVVSAYLKAIANRTKQSNAFVYLPIIYGVGGITGPLVGGLLVSENPHFSPSDPYPYVRPNIVSAVILIVDLIVILLFFEDSLEESKELAPLNERVRSLLDWAWQSVNSTRLKFLRIQHRSYKHLTPSSGDATADDEEDSSSSDCGSQISNPTTPLTQYNILSQGSMFERDTLLLISTYSVFQLSNVSYNSLFPIFGQAAPQTGRNLSPEEIGCLLVFAGTATIVFQYGVFGRLRESMGIIFTYRACLLSISLVFFVTPWIGYKDTSNGDGGMFSSKTSLWIELGFLLLIKAAAAVGCLTSASTLVSSSASSLPVLNKLNVVVQTVSAAGRAAGPFLAGGLFSLSMHVEPKGEAIAFGVFGGVAFVGFLLSLGIRQPDLETDGLGEESGSEDYVDDDEDERTER